MFLKGSVSIVLVLAFALVLSGGPTYFKFRQSLSELVGSRVQVYVLGLQNTIETGLALGLTLPFLRDMQEVIERVKRNDPNIAAVTVFEITAEGGRVLYDTDRGRIGRLVPESWPREPGRSHDPPWMRVEEESFVYGMP